MNLLLVLTMEIAVSDALYWSKELLDLCPMPRLIADPAEGETRIPMLADPQFALVSKGLNNAAFHS